MEKQKQIQEMPKPKKMRAANRVSTREFVDAEKASVNESERTIVHTISSSIIDRYGEIVDPKGMVQENYAKNPVVLFGHNNGDAWMSGSPPTIPVVGKSLWRKTQDERILSKTKFGESTDFMEDVWNLAKDGFLPATSIGFIPLAYEVKKLGEVSDLNPSNRAEFDKAMDVFIWRKWELLEYSLVPIPANPEALQNAFELARSKTMKGILSQIQLEQRLCDLEGCRKDMEVKVEQAVLNVGEKFDREAFKAELFAEILPEMTKINEFISELKVKEEENRKKLEVAVDVKRIDADAFIGRTVDGAIRRMRGKVT